MKRFVSIALACLISTAAFAQQPPTIDYTPVSCLRAGEYVALFASTNATGEPRLYYRRLGAAEWCYVEGVRLPRTDRFRAILPEFERDIEVEYFFLTVEEGEVTARSPRIYRARVANQCDITVARGMDFLLNTCENGPGELGSAIAAGYAIQSDAPDEVSPSSPE